MSGGTQYLVDLRLQPIISNTNYVVWKVTAAELRKLLKGDPIRTWKKLRDGPMPRLKQLHPTAIKRTKPPRPVREFLEKHDVPHPKRYRVLYVGVGRDYPGLKAISRNGRYDVRAYDPFHTEKKFRKYPVGIFSEVWSIYTLNIVDRETGLHMLREMLDWLQDDDHFAVIAVRRDNI